MTSGGESPRHDFRMPVLGAAAWLAGVAAAVLGAGAIWLLGALALIVVFARDARRRLATAALLLGTAVVASTLLRQVAVAESPLHRWAQDRATADLVATVVSDPRRVEGAWGDLVVVRLRVEEVTARGVRVRLGGTVVALGDPAWAEVTLGERVLAEGRLAPSDRPQEAALLTGARPPVRIRGPDPWWRASGAVRASIRDAVAHRPPDQAGLVPALVDGDDAGLPAAVEEDFRTTGLTHDSPC